MYEFLSGSVFMGSLVAGMFFLKFWKSTHDRLFLIFALAFAVLAFERMVLVLGSDPSEANPAVYLFRLSAFLLIMAGIWDKNRSAG